MITNIINKNTTTTFQLRQSGLGTKSTAWNKRLRSTSDSFSQELQQTAPTISLQTLHFNETTYPDGGVICSADDHFRPFWSLGDTDDHSKR